jgi:hypothetical protein
MGTTGNCRVLESVPGRYRHTPRKNHHWGKRKLKRDM